MALEPATGVAWRKTMELRWLEHQVPTSNTTSKTITTLQQLWTTDEGKTREWRDVPIVPG